MTYPVYKRGQTLTISIFPRQSGDTCEVSLKPAQLGESPVEAVATSDDFTIVNITDTDKGAGWSASLSATETDALDVGNYAFDVKITGATETTITSTIFFTLIDRVTP